MIGKAMSRPMQIKSMMMNGFAACMISFIVVSDGATPFITKRSRPNGGVFTPISMVIRAMIPNHRGSNPRVRARGMKIGIEIIMIET